MKRVLLVSALAIGVAGVTGCSQGPPAPAPPAEANGAPPPKDSGAAAGEKKGPRIPPKK
jgi:predicted small lipoprotein YifL